MQTRGELLPLEPGFDVVWRGFDRAQVRRYVQAAEDDARWLAADRDAAVARADAVAEQLEQARAEIAALQERLDRVSRTPIPPDALTDRLRRMVELAHAEAEEITGRARAAAERSWSTANDAAARVRSRSEQLVRELDRRRAETEAEHRELMDRAHAEVEVMTRQAERRRRELDAEAEAVRRQVSEDFDLAMAQRRAESMRELAERAQAGQEKIERLIREGAAKKAAALAEVDRILREAAERKAAAQAEARRLVQEAADEARRIEAEAQLRVDVLRGRRSGISDELRKAQRLLLDAEPLLDPLPEEEPLLTIPRQAPEMSPLPTG